MDLPGLIVRPETRNRRRSQVGSRPRCLMCGNPVYNRLCMCPNPTLLPEDKDKIQSANRRRNQMAIRPGVDEFIAFLNSLLEHDCHTLDSLISIRVPCSEDLLEHPSVQVNHTAGELCRVGFLGIMNGYFGTIDEGEYKGWGPIAVQYKGNRLFRFVRTGEHDKEQSNPALGSLPPVGAVL